MVRPKSYDRQKAVENACLAFWEHGFQALGVRELEQQTGINQFAIRSEFGGKEGLLLEALNYYRDAAITNEMAPMWDGGIPEIITFLRGLVTPGSMTSSQFGCLMVNTGVENARLKSPALGEATRGYWTELESHFTRALENELRAQGGKVRFSPAELAAALVSAVMGVHVQNRTQKDQTAGRALVDLMCNRLAELRASS
ncbi:TetR/AcrR family transcriptional regulator [Stappia sp. BW2]|uniref:TetR/AcrR family transcriptional regulator n=1 Tax=Stappia sp. BW2 TaxID=2592622 RepID=UPI0011DE9F65|nr:TetR/AcrR family transcriptional regulator [Stappia sp. BW2]TYC64094.1 TetR/AcrR family transcriptional regulator [Stappia sp. BW2]